MKSYLFLVVSCALLLTAAGCAQSSQTAGADASRPSHYAMRTNQLGSNIPQPYAAGADSNSVTQANAVNQMDRASTSLGSMSGGGGGGR